MRKIHRGTIAASSVLILGLVLYFFYRDVEPNSIKDPLPRKVENGSRVEGSVNPKDPVYGAHGSLLHSFVERLNAAGGVQRYGIAKEMVAACAANNANEVFDLITKGFDGAEKSKLLVRFFSLLAESNPDKCKALFESLAPGGGTGQVYLAILQNSNGLFVAENLSWFEEHLDGDIEREMVGLPLKSLSQLPAETLTSLLKAAKSHPFQRAIASAFGDAWARGNDFSNISNILAAIPKDSHSDFLISAYSRYATDNPIASVENVLRVNGANDQLKVVLPMVIGRAAAANPKDTITSISRVTDLETQRLAMIVAVGTWLQHDPIAASQYVKSMPSGRGRDHAAAKISQYSISKGDPDAALAWQKFIEAEDIRSRTTTPKEQ